MERSGGPPKHIRTYPPAKEETHPTEREVGKIIDSKVFWEGICDCFQEGRLVSHVQTNSFCRKNLHEKNGQFGGPFRLFFG